jgi:hypothetical protein
LVGSDRYSGGKEKQKVDEEEILLQGDLAEI